MATTSVATAQQNSLTNRILHDDCIQVMGQMPANSVDFILTDPPYLVNYRDCSGRTIQNDVDESWLKPVMAEAYRVLKHDRVAVMFYGWTKIDSFFEAWRSAGFQPVGHIVFSFTARLYSRGNLAKSLCFAYAGITYHPAPTARPARLDE
jgi:DNA modification methylase